MGHVSGDDTCLGKHTASRTDRETEPWMDKRNISERKRKRNQALTGPSHKNMNNRTDVVGLRHEYSVHATF